jgi:KUP system potassium uptake protein
MAVDIQATAPTPGTDSPTPVSGDDHPKASFWTLTLGSIGVVYGDIGTSPLYALKESVAAASAGREASPEIIIGVLSLMIWALVIVVTLKYVVLLLRADNNGEGGTLTLMALAQKAIGQQTTRIAVLGMIGAALFYGDAMLTPAISVLSAIEGVKLATPALEPYVVPITLVIIVALFAAQSRGTATVGALFGPITLVWFIVLAWLGVVNVVKAPQVLTAINPLYGASFLLHHGLIGFAVLGAVFLTVTGAEALYADLGHFGRKPIQTAWLALVFPALVINYLGQGALLIGRPEAIENPFYLMAPEWALIPMILLASAATIIASQAVITGAYSLTQQAIQLGLLPRMEIRHTSEAQSGQIYMPRINWIIMVGVLALVIMFRSSSALAAAYGIAVSGTMVVTAIMAFVVMRRLWKWNVATSALVIAPFLAIDAIFLASNSMKIHEGGYIPLAIGLAVMIIMITWRRGTALLFERTRRTEVPLSVLVESLARKERPRVEGTAVYLTGDPQYAPTALLHSLKHYKALHQRNVILSVNTLNVPRVPPEQRVHAEQIGENFVLVRIEYGFYDTPQVARALATCRKLPWKFDIMSTSFFLSRRLLKIAERPMMPRWQDRLFILLSATAERAVEFYHIPTDRSVELGTQISI